MEAIKLDSAVLGEKEEEGMSSRLLRLRQSEEGTQRSRTGEAFCGEASGKPFVVNEASRSGHTCFGGTTDGISDQIDPWTRLTTT